MRAAFASSVSPVTVAVMQGPQWPQQAAGAASCHRARNGISLYIQSFSKHQDCTPMDLTLINLDSPTETRSFEKGKFELFEVGPMTIGRATYEPGWVWSEHVGTQTGESSCQVEHVGLVISGQAAVKMDDGTERVMKEGDFFYVPPGHDSWVVGDEPYVSLHVMGSQSYAT